MSAKVIQFGKLKVYRSVCKVCSSLLEYDAREAEVFFDDKLHCNVYGVLCPACRVYNEFNSDARVEYREINLVTIPPHLV